MDLYMTSRLEGLSHWVRRGEGVGVLAMALPYSTTVLPNACPLSLLALSLLYKKVISEHLESQHSHGQVNIC